MTPRVTRNTFKCGINTWTTRIKLMIGFVQIEFYLPAMLLGGWPDYCVCECSPAMPSGRVEVRPAVGATCRSGPFLYADQDYHLYLTSPSHPHSSPQRSTPHMCNMRPSMFHCCQVTIIWQLYMSTWSFSLKNEKQQQNCKETGALGPEQGQHNAAVLWHLNCTWENVPQRSWQKHATCCTWKKNLAAHAEPHLSY